MPWTIEDVDKHKQGLTTKQKKQWVRIANAALKTCMGKGGADETCAVKAIKQANGVVVNNNSAGYSEYKNAVEAEYEAILTVHQEKPHYVVPVVLMVEGVHNGSRGKVFHSIDELGKIPESWNGIPIVIDHPANDEGTPISANSPEVIDKVTVGRVYNTNVDLDEKKLKAEAWFDEEKLNLVAPEILEDITNGKMREVSVGVFSDEDDTPGEWNGEEYETIATNHRPDHLAILTEYVGACSCKDGCGIRANKENKKEMEKQLFDSMKSLNLAGYSFSQIENYAKAGYKEKIDAVYSALREIEKEGIYCYLEEMFDSDIVYSKSSKGGTKMYKQDYTFESGKIELVGNPVEVHRKVEFITNQMNRTKFKKEVKMANECAPCIKTKVDALIANSQGRWKENDREFLQTLTEDQLDKMAPITVEKVVEKEVQVNVLSKEDQDALATYKREQKAKREQLITDIQTNSSKDMWPDETLKGMNDDTLQRVFNSVKKEVVDYSGMGGGTPLEINAAEDVMPLLPTGVEETEK